MKLEDLEPRWLKITLPDRFMEVDSIAEADGIQFFCPKCFEANGGPVGTHMVICWRPRVPSGQKPGPGRWELHGSGYGDLTLIAGSSSVLLTSGCRAHFYIRNGTIEMLAS